MHTVGTIVSRFTGKRVARVLTPSDSQYPADIVRDACICLTNVGGAEIEIVYYGRCVHVAITDGVKMEDVRRNLLAILIAAKEASFKARTTRA